MRLAYVTNLPAPYRVAFLNELGRYCELTVFYERQSASDRDANWRAEKPESYHEVYCSDRPIGADQSLGFDLMRRVRKAKFDRLLISGYSSPAVMALILDCQRRRIPYYMQYDGGFPAAGGLRQTLKKRLLQPAAGHFTSSDVHAEYLRSLGIRPERIWKYPFTSLTEEDILATPISDINRAAIRRELGVTEARIVLAVGRFIPCKGFDVLLQAAHLMQEPDLGFYLVGGEATLEYAELCRAYGLTNVHFVSFQQKKALRRWYQMSDLFCLPTRGDTWGLVINEAFANALPVVTTTACGAGVELVCGGINGALVPPEDPAALAEAIRQLLSGDIFLRRQEALNTIRGFTAANMARKHAEILLPDFCQKEAHERVANKN